MDDVLIHYGVLGMKWGVRRYQNKDGSLTSAGKKRYSGDSDSSSGVSDAKRQQHHPAGRHHSEDSAL